jgi:DNA-binding transcriptional MerR regulator
MVDALPDVQIPDRPTFKATEVCELLKIQAYVLRSWENEFTDLGVSRTPGAPRVYRRSDVELALRIRQLVFGEGLTLAGVRRRFEQERPAPPDEDEIIAAPRTVDPRTRERLEQARQGLRSVLAMLDARRGAAGTPRPSAPPRKSPHSRPTPSRTPDSGLFGASLETGPAAAEPPAGTGARRPARRKHDGSA